MASGSVYAIKMHMVYSGQQCRPGFYLIEGTGTGDTIGTRGVAEHVIATLGAANMAEFSASLTFPAVEAQDVQPATERSFVVGTTGPLVGGVADAHPPAPQDCALIQWLTALKGGKGLVARRSRTYMPGIYATGQTSGFLEAAMVDAFSTFASILFDEYVTSGAAYQMHAVAFTPGSNPRTIQEVNPITAFTIDNVVAIQRSRRAGTGI